MVNFDNDKKQHMHKLKHLDKSKKGFVDEPILKLVNLINSKKDYYTTSSCSGRIVVTAFSDDMKKNKTKWLFVSHALIKKNQFNLKLVRELTYLRFEPFIIHIVAKDIDCATKLLQSAKDIGLKRAGIISAKNRIVLEIIGHDWLVAPIAKDNNLLIDKDYLKFLIKEANIKFRNNQKRIDLFYGKIKSL